MGGVPWGYRRSADLMRIEPDAGASVRLYAWQRYASGDVTMATLADRPARERTLLAAPSDAVTTPVQLVEEFFRSRVDLDVGGLDPTIYERARAILARRAMTRAKPGLRRHAYLSTSLARWGECGENLWGRMSVNRYKPRPYAQLYHAPRGCRRGALSEEKLAGEWLQTWCLPADASTRIARYLGRTRSDDRVVRRSQLAAELERLRNLYRWGDLEQRDFLTQRTAVQRAIEELGPDIAPRPSRDALKLAGEIGRALNDVSAQTRRRFLEEWFEQILIHRDGRVEVMPREAVRGIVYAAQVGIAGSPPALPTGASSTHTGEARIKPVGPPHRAHQ